MNFLNLNGRRKMSGETYLDIKPKKTKSWILYCIKTSKDDRKLYAATITTSNSWNNQKPYLVGYDTEDNITFIIADWESVCAWHPEDDIAVAEDPFAYEEWIKS